MSNSQRVKYFEWDGIEIKCKGIKLPQKYFKIKSREFCQTSVIENLKDEYVIGILGKKGIEGITRKTENLSKNLGIGLKHILCEIIDNTPTPIIANHTKVGKPKFYLIKGQDIYSGNLREHMRGFVMDKIKECYYPYIKDLKPIEYYPVKIRCEVHDTIKNSYDRTKNELGIRWDIDNLVYPYLKAFPDLLVKHNILKDDDRLHLPSSIHADFVPIENHEDRKLIFIIEKDERDIIKNNKLFQKFHKDSYESEDTELVKEENEEPFNILNDDVKSILYNVKK
jgi:hypothetical protein